MVERREMQVVVHGHGVEITPALQAQVAGQALAALGRFGGRIGRVTVRLHAPSNEAGELAICHVLVDIHPSGGLGVGEAAPSLDAAADRALGKAGAAVSAQLMRRRRVPEHGSLAYSFFR
jgi:ribosome-associated translation inhibitor RaiA